MANANPAVEAAAKTVAAANATPPADAKASAPAAEAAEAGSAGDQQAFSPDTENALDARGSGTSTMPREWLDSTKTVKYSNRGDSFGALMAGDDVGSPAEDMIAGHSAPISEEEAAADEGGITDGKSVEVADDAGETTEEPAAATEAEAEPAAEVEKVEPKKEPEKIDLKKTHVIRRTALDAMRIEAEKRQLEGRLRDERKAREQVMSDRAAFEAKLKTAPMDERLRMIGVRDKDALLEMQLRGEIPDFKEPEPAAKVEPAKPADDPEKAALAKRVADLEARDQQREAAVQQARAQQTANAAAAGVRAILSAPEVAAEVKFTLASGNEAIADVMARAEQLWVASGSKPGDENRHVIAAGREAEAVLAEKYAPILAAAGYQPVSSIAKPKVPGPVIPVKPPAKKLNVAGKNLGGRGSTLEDDLPLDSMMRDAIIKRERGWGG